MSYIEDKITIKEYLDNIQDKGKKNHIKAILNQFDIFCVKNIIFVSLGFMKII